MLTAILLTVGALLKTGQVVVRNLSDLIPQHHHNSAITVENSIMVTSMAAIFAHLFYLERLCDKKNVGKPPGQPIFAVNLFLDKISAKWNPALI